MVPGALPAKICTCKEIEERIALAGNGFSPRAGIIQAMSGIQAWRIASDGVQYSDLAAQARRQVLQKTGTDPRDVDLLIYASAGQDLIEPATAHIIQAKMGTDCPVFDVKNACNSFLNGMQLAESLILNGVYETVLVSVGEAPSRGIDWRAGSLDEFKRNLPGYTMGDAGAAALLTPASDGCGIFLRDFAAISKYWDLTTIAGGGSMNPRGDEHTYLRANSSHLKRAFRELGLPFFAQRIAQGPGLV